MPTLRASRPRGRPAKQIAEILSTQFFCRAVLIRSGVAIPTLVRTLLSPHCEEDRARVIERNWYRYFNGKRCIGLRSQGYDCVEEAERVFPGVRRWLDSPIWRVLKRAPLGALEINAELRQLDHAVVATLYPIASVPAWPSRDAIASLPDNPCFDALVASVLLMALAELSLDAGLHTSAQIALLQLMSTAHDIPQVGPLADQLRSTIAKRFFDGTDLRATQP